jgi:23S rRNA G2445 N2-methylase RlmL
MATKTSPHQFIKEKFAFCKLLPFQAYHFDDFFKKLDKEREFKGTIHALDPNFKNVQHTKKNAKIAGVVKLLEFGRAELEFLDAKFGKEAVDSIVTVPMQPSRQIPDNLYEKVIHNLFYHADFILKKDGKMVLAIKRGQEQIKKKAAELNFILIHERTVKTGEESLTLLVFSPQAPSSSPGTRP